MKVFTTIKQLKNHLSDNFRLKHTIGFVPTMGALHQGHLSLINESKKQQNITVCSIYVNPTQFNDPKDFEKYPITIEQDKALLEQADCDILFIPNTIEMYPKGFTRPKKYELGTLEEILDGYHRKGHFQGVCQIVEKLLLAVEPNNLFLGQKDYQQCMVIKKLVQLINLNHKIKIHICDTKREHDGLAMSSRNVRLSKEARLQATAIFNSFWAVKSKLRNGDVNFFLETHKTFLLENGFESIDYFTIANAITLENINNWNGKDKIVILAAAFIDGVRLIDNMIIN